MENNTRQHKSKHDEKNWLEWLVFCVSLLLLVSILSYLVYQVIHYQATEPDIVAEATPDPSGSMPNRYSVAVFNKGGTTAEEVLVEFILFTAGEEKEKSELLIAFSPRESKQEGWISFSGKPVVSDSVVTRVVSYKKP